MRLSTLLFFICVVCSSVSADVSVTFKEADRRALEPKEREVVTEIATDAIREIATVLPGLPETIEVEVVSGSEVSAGFGSVGFAAAPGNIRWTVDPDIGVGPIETARSELRSMMFHETHHLVRGWTASGITDGMRMIDAAFAEGMATAFEPALG